MSQFCSSDVAARDIHEPRYGHVIAQALSQLTDSRWLGQAAGDPSKEPPDTVTLKLKVATSTYVIQSSLPQLGGGNVFFKDS